MNVSSTSPTPGRYRYVYPTFVDAPRFIDIHFITPDGKQAFVSYPNHPNHRAAQLIQVSWFGSVTMHRLEGQPTLMALIETLLTGWSVTSSDRRPARNLRRAPVSQRYHQRMAV